MLNAWSGIFGCTTEKSLGIVACPLAAWETIAVNSKPMDRRAVVDFMAVGLVLRVLVEWRVIRGVSCVRERMNSPNYYRTLNRGVSFRVTQKVQRICSSLQSRVVSIDLPCRFLVAIPG
jgi:hypothetical protein